MCQVLKETRIVRTAVKCLTMTIEWRNVRFEHRIRSLSQSRLVAAVLLGVFLLSPGCSIPQTELSVYREASAEAADATTTMWLQARIDARRVADHPLNPATAGERTRQLAERLEDIDFRLDAVAVIKRYDSALIALAEGHDPKAVESDVRGMLEGIKSIPLAPIGRFVAESTPYAGAITATIDLLESAMLAKRFREALDAAVPAIASISELLVLDAHSLAEIRSQLVLLEHDDVTMDLIQMVAAFNRLAGTPDGWATMNDAARRSRFESAISGVRRLPRLNSTPPEGSGQVDAAIAATVEQMIIEAYDKAARLAVIDAAVTANARAAMQYHELLTKWRLAHDSLQNATGQVDVAAARDMVKSILDMREAWMAAVQATNRAE